MNDTQDLEMLLSEDIAIANPDFDMTEHVTVQDEV